MRVGETASLNVNILPDYAPQEFAANILDGIILFVAVVTGGKTEYKVLDNQVHNLAVTFTVSENSTYQCKVGVNNGGPVDATLYPMLETGSEAHAYKPYA